MHAHSSKSHDETPQDPQRNLPLSDYTNAEALVSRHGDDMRYCHPWAKWLIWNERHWEIDTSGRVMRWAKQTIRALHGRLVDMDDEKEYTAWRQHIKISLSTGSLTAMVRQAQCELPVQPEAFDTHPWLLNCANGLPLRIGEIFGARLYLIYRESLASPIKKRRLNENAGQGFLRRLNAGKSLSSCRLNK